MTPRRDPSTGKFVSGSGERWDELEVLYGGIAATIPAADLSGGLHHEWVAGSETEVIDFTAELDREEVFETRVIDVTVTLSMPTTATAEGAAEMEWALSSNFDNEPSPTPTFYGGDLGEESGTADINASQMDDAGSLLTVGRLTATPSIADTVNALAAGGDDDRRQKTLTYGRGPRFDDNDQIAAPFSFHIDNVSDHAVVGTVDVMIAGIVDEDMEC